MRSELNEKKGLYFQKVYSSCKTTIKKLDAGEILEAYTDLSCYYLLVESRDQSSPA